MKWRKVKERTQNNHRKAKSNRNGQNWRIFTQTAFGKTGKHQPAAFKYISICLSVSLLRLGNHSCMLCGIDFADERLLLCKCEVSNSCLTQLPQITWLSPFEFLVALQTTLPNNIIVLVYILFLQLVLLFESYNVTLLEGDLHASKCGKLHMNKSLYY